MTEIKTPELDYEGELDYKVLETCRDVVKAAEKELDALKKYLRINKEIPGWKELRNTWMQSRTDHNLARAAYDDVRWEWRQKEFDLGR